MKGFKILCCICFIGGSIFSQRVLAQKVNFDVGAYKISASPPQGSGTSSVVLSGLGSYSVSANFELTKPFEIGVGYTLFYSKTLSGDMGFGPDFYLYYFPVNEGSGLRIRNPTVEYYEIQQWRPYLNLAFHQRQFQSAQSAYSGFGFGAGTEWQWKERTSIRAGIRSMSLTGPSSASFTYFDFLLGFQLQFREL